MRPMWRSSSGSDMTFGSSSVRLGASAPQSNAETDIGTDSRIPDSRIGERLLETPAIEIDIGNLARVADVVERIGVEHDETRALADGQRAEIRQTHQLRRP